MTRQRRWVWVVVVLAIVVVGLVVWRIVGSGAGGSQTHAPAVPVVTAPAREGAFVVNVSAPGTVTPLNTVVVHASVSGRLTSLAFKEGQMVKQGDLLATIDPAPFKAQLQLATGGLARDKALLANAQGTLKRYRTLLAQQSMVPQRVSDQESLVQQYAAAVKADQSRVDIAALQLAHTRITAPISGMTGLREVDPGNLVGPSDTAGIVRVTQLSPTSVVFAVPGDVLPQVMQQLRGGHVIPVQAFGRGDAELAQGRLLASDNRIDPATGTLKLKAGFANADGRLFPNQPVTVRVPLQTLSHATLVPSAAIQHGAAGAFVYVIDSDRSARVVPVRVGPDNGTTSVIEHGIAPGATVVVEGADRLRDGTVVAPVTRSAHPASAASAAGKHSGGPAATS